MEGFKGQPHQGLVSTVMAALSARTRRSAHPADRRRLREEAMQVAAAVEAGFSVAERPAALTAGTDRPAALARTYE